MICRQGIGASTWFSGGGKGGVGALVWDEEAGHGPRQGVGGGGGGGGEVLEAASPWLYAARIWSSSSISSRMAAMSASILSTWQGRKRVGGAVLVVDAQRKVLKPAVLAYTSAGPLPLPMGC